MFLLQDVLQGNRESLVIHGPKDLSPSLIFRSAQHDSRLCKAGDLYVALKGARVDGHQFIPEVARAGAVGVLCAAPHPAAPANFLQLVVPDVLKALQAIARVRVLRQPETCRIAIT